MTESTKILCLCGKTLRASVGGAWVDEQWYCGECLVKAASARKIAIEKLEEEITSVEEGVIVAQNKGTRNLREHESKIRLVARCKGKLKGLRFALGLLKSEK